MCNDDNYGFRSQDLEHKIMYSFSYRLSKGPSYSEYESIMSGSEGPPEASKGPPEASKGPPKASEGPAHNI